MIKKSSILFLSFGLMALVGCESKAGTGAISGGAGGAAIGGLVGGTQGALIGGAAGVITGGLLGTYLDNNEQKKLKQESMQTYQRIESKEKLRVNDIIALSKAKISDDKIITLIKKTGSTYSLNQYKINKLHNAHVSEKVINHMLSN